MTELDALLDRVAEDKRDPRGLNRTQVAYDCWRMFEDLAKRFKEESRMRDFYSARSRAWMDRCLRFHALLIDVSAIDDGDDPGLWKYDELFLRIRMELDGDTNHASDCAHWVNEPCDCVTAKAAL